MPGYTQSAGLANPAAGSDFVISLPADEPVRIKTIRAVLTTSATVDNRSVVLNVLDQSGQIIASLPAPAVQTASTTAIYTWGVGLGPFAPAALVQATAFPDLWLAPSCSLKSVTGLIQAGDAWTLVALSYELSSLYTEFWQPGNH